MNKAEILDALSGRTGLHRDEDAVGSALARGDKVLLPGFGTFEAKRRAARPGRNPQTGETIEIPGAVLPRFSPGKLLKDKVAGGHKPRETPQGKASKPKAVAKEAPAGKPGKGAKK